jgi:hypothetical protein
MATDCGKLGYTFKSKERRRRRRRRKERKKGEKEEGEGRRRRRRRRRREEKNIGRRRRKKKEKKNRRRKKKKQASLLSFSFSPFLKNDEQTKSLRVPFQNRGLRMPMLATRAVCMCMADVAAKSGRMPPCMCWTSAPASGHRSFGNNKQMHN